MRSLEITEKRSVTYDGTRRRVLVSLIRVLDALAGEAIFKDTGYVLVRPLYPYVVRGLLVAIETPNVSQEACGDMSCVWTSPISKRIMECLSQL